MKVAVIGSRGITKCDLASYLPENTDEIVSGGAKGIDACAREYANKNGIKLTEFLPEYDKYGRGAPLRRNIQIIEYADLVIAFWDGKSRGTRFVMDKCEEKGIPTKFYLFKNSEIVKEGKVRICGEKAYVPREVGKR